MSNNEYMHVLIFSDTHLNQHFERRKYLFLRKIIRQADRVIINGDFWEGWHISFDEFLNSPWNQLFLELKKKQTVYIFGNHDKKSLMDKRVSLFSSVQANKYSFMYGKKKFTVMHGHTFKLSYKKIAYTQLGKYITHGRYFGNTMQFIEKVLIILRYEKIIFNRLKIFNKEIKTQSEKLLKENEFLIVGHTHAIEYDSAYRFINTGFIKNGIGQYLFIKNGKILLKTERY